jgi:hypothetical protein
MNGDAALGIENEVVLDARQREIAAELWTVIDRRSAGRKDFDDDDGSSMKIVTSDRRGPQTTDASGSNDVRSRS